MTGKNILLAAVVLLLGGLCLYVYRDRFSAPPIQISHRFVEPRGAMLRRANNENAEMVIFLLNRELRLTSVKVIPVRNVETGGTPHPIWDLISDSRSVPVTDFAYGLNIGGMRPAAKGAVAGPLQPGVKYRLLIKAGSHKAEHDFIPVPRTPPSGADGFKSNQQARRWTSIGGDALSFTSQGGTPLLGRPAARAGVGPPSGRQVRPADNADEMGSLAADESGRGLHPAE